MNRPRYIVSDWVLYIGALLAAACLLAEHLQKGT
jgi:hypothetical protein